MTSATFPETEVTTIPILWMDDQFDDTIRILNGLLRKEQAPIIIEHVKSIRDARERIKSNEYGAVVVDFRMDDYDRSQDGARFLAEIQSKFRALPTFVFSGFLEDSHYQKQLEECHPWGIHNKNAKLPRPSDPFFVDLIATTKDYWHLRNQRPERVEFREYLLRPDDFVDTFAVHWRKHRHWIEWEMSRRNAMWVVVCGEAIAAHSSHADDFPDDEQLIEIGNQQNRVPFAYDRAIPIEESGYPSGDCKWHSTRYSDDAYPTVMLSVRSNPVVGDLDTGAFRTHLPEGLSNRSVVPPAWRKESHLGESFHYFSRSTEVTVTDGQGVTQSRSMQVNFVKNWSASPFVQVNPGRGALVGRDFFRVFDCTLTLDSGAKATRMKVQEKP